MPKNDEAAEMEWQRLLHQKKEDFDRKFTKEPGKDSSLGDWERLKTLGAGAFGRVILAKHHNTKEFAAIKIMEKEKVVKLNQVEHTLNEKKILTAIEFPNLIYMIANFKARTTAMSTWP